MLAPAGLVLPRRLIPSLMLIHHEGIAGARPTPATVAALEDHRAIRSGRLTPHAEVLVEVMTDPLLVLSVEVTTTGGARRATVWSTGEDAVWGRPVDGDTFELRRLDPIQVPLLLAQVTGLGHRPAAPFAGEITVETAALVTALDRGADDPDGALGVLVESGADPVWADRLLIAHDLRRGEWTLSAVSCGRDENPRIHELHVLDAGAAGYWRIERGDTETTYRVTRGAELMAALRGVAPVTARNPR